MDKDKTKRIKSGILRQLFMGGKLDIGALALAYDTNSTGVFSCLSQLEAEGLISRAKARKELAFSLVERKRS